MIMKIPTTSIKTVLIEASKCLISLIPYIEVSHYFKNQNKKFSNLVKDSTIYRFITSDDPSIGARENLVAPYPTLPLTHGNQPKNSFNYYIPFYNPYQVPGFELLVFVISLCIVILIFKYRKKDRRTPR